jgi:SAM-dependent methyltransferase
MEKPVKINLGCGVGLKGGWINVDNTYEEADIRGKQGLFRNAKVDDDAVYVKADARDLPFDDDFADHIECVDMIEHVPFNQTVLVLAEMLRVLKPGGTVLVTTVDFDELARLWMEWVAGKDLDFKDTNGPFYDLMEVIYGNQRAPGEYHVSAFNPRYMNALFKHAGFEDIVITVYPTGCTNMPPLQTYTYPEGSIARTQLLVLEAKKPTVTP